MNMIQLHQGDCLDVMRTLPDGCVDSVVADPPYGLKFMGKRWDHGVPSPEVWAEVLRVIKPGGYLLSFGGTRTYHRLVVNIEDAGFEIRDQIGWVFGSGFPKSHNGEWGGTALKPAWEPICMARKPLEGTVEENWRKWGTGALAIDACRVDTRGERTGGSGAPKQGTAALGNFTGNGGNTTSALGRWPANLIHDGSDEVLAAFPTAPGQMADASSSSSRKTQNVYGAMARGNGREGEASADNANEGTVGFKMKPGARRADAGSAARFFYCAKASRKDRNDGVEHLTSKPLLWSSGTQSPGTFQAEGTDRSSPNNHPTVKPTDLMRYLCRLVTPAGGVVLDPFMGSGSTGRGAVMEGLGFIGIERDEGYFKIAQDRIDAAMPIPDWLRVKAA